MGQGRKSDNREMVQGTLDMLILRTLVGGRAHGHTIAQMIEQSSDDVLQVEQGSLYPALNRLLVKGWLTADWGLSDNNRKARFYRLTEEGRRQMEQETQDFDRMVDAIRLVLKTV